MAEHSLEDQELAQLEQVPAFKKLVHLFEGGVNDTISKLVEVTEPGEMSILVGRLRAEKRLLAILKTAPQDALKRLENYKQELQEFNV